MAAVKKGAPAPSTALKKWDEELAKYAENKAKEEASVSLGKFFSVKSGVLSFNGNVIPGNKMNVVVLDSILENHLYEDAYDPDSPASPVCFAFGREDKDMAPHEKSLKPQNETCKGCPHNEWGSADKGRGKACKNVRRLALVPESAVEDADALDAEETAYLKLSVMNVKGWAAYVQNLSATLKRPPFAVVTEISVVPDAKSQFKISFKYVESINNSDMLDAILKKVKVTEETIGFPYQAMEAPPPAKPNKFTAKGGRR